MNTSVPQHLNETPAISFLFAAITAQTPREIKSLATTIQRGMTLLGENGYTWTRRNAGFYLVDTPAGDTYNVAYDPAQNVASCTCEACIRLGVCKHLVCLHLNKATIDAENEVRDGSAIEYVAPAQPAPKPAGSAWDRWNAFFDDVDAAKAAQRN